jgi:hypothetical protein
MEQGGTLSICQATHQFGVVLHHPGVDRFEFGTSAFAALRLASLIVLLNSLLGIHTFRLRRVIG